MEIFTISRVHIIGMASLAQLVRASDCGPEGHGFESHSSPHMLNWQHQVNELMHSN